ncbi:hypothetical protein B6I21_06665 [candidate division KSB1 bacterium 4572_119]|nr:MAG: hypothetical protein B6I21_06665 [candidate division KSB1 bacterium 4572_119]
MSDEIYKIVLNKKEKIKKLWRETSKSSGQKIDGKCLLSLLEFLEDIINKKDEKFLNAKMERILSGCYFSDFTGNLSFFNDIILGKDVICKIVGQTLLFESKNLDELFTFSKRFDETLIRAFDYYYDKNSAVVIQRKKVFEEAADFLKSAVNFTKIGLFILDKNMRIIYWGEGIARMYDIEEKEVLNQQVLDVFPALKDEGIFQKMLNVLNSGEPGELLSQAHQTLKKGKRFIDFKISPLKDSEKNIIGVNVLLNDVTELKKDQQSLLEYEQFISNIFEDAAEAIFVLDCSLD